MTSTKSHECKDCEREGGNNLLDTIVFGTIAGGEAAKLAKQGMKGGNSKKTKEAPSQPKKSNVDNQTKGFDDNINDNDYYYGGIFVVKEPIKFRNEIQELMMQNAGARTEKASKWIEQNFRNKK